MAQYRALANFFVTGDRIARKGELLELDDRAALDALRNGRVEPADEESRRRFKRKTLTIWNEPEQTAASAVPSRWLPWH